MGGSPEELSRDYYHTTSIKYLTIFVKTLNFGIFFYFTSMELTKDSYFVTECFKMLFEDPQFKNFNVNNELENTSIEAPIINSSFIY